MISVSLPLVLVILLQHESLIVRRHEPVVVAGVELRRTCQRCILFDLLDSIAGPLVLEHPQVQIVVHGVIVELFLLHLVHLVFKAGVDPLD